MNFFSDSELRARQDGLNSQWSSLWGTYNATCSNGLGNAFPEFATDYRNWQEFYASGSDWSGESKHATDEHQRKMQEWAKRLKDYGCGDSQYSDLGIPGVKDVPPDKPGFLDDLKDVAGKGAYAWVFTVVLVLAFVGLMVYFLSKSKVAVGA
jgi:hypothetical protein